MVRPTILAATAAIVLGASAAPAADVPRDAVVLERYEGLYVPPWAVGAAAAGGGRIVFGDFVSIQVNIDALGQDVIGDAANEPSITVDPTAPNRVAVGWRQFNTINSSFREMGNAHSTDGGRTWTNTGVVEPGTFRTDPVLRAASGGTMYYLSLEVTPTNEFLCDVYTSTDGGATWPVKTAAFGGDKAWLAVDTTQGAGHLYQAWNTAGNEFFPNQFNRSIDGSLSWQSPVEYDPLGNPPARPVFGQVNVGGDGAVYVAGSMNSFDTDTFWVVKSVNAQNPLAMPTFTDVSIDLGGSLLIGAGPNPAGLLGQVNVAVDDSGGPLDGNVYVLGSVDPSGIDPMDIHLIRSEDGGATWSTPVRVNNDPPPPIGSPSWQWFGTMDVAPDGRIDVVWNDTSDSGQDNVSQLMYAHSDDGGATWVGTTAVSPPFDSHVGFPQQDKLGDYYDIVSDRVGAHVIYAATFLGGQDVYYVRIGDYDCNDNGVGDGDDLAGMTSFDCNGNDIPDECEIAAGTEPDDNGNGVPDSCEPACPWDLDGSGAVGTSDLLELLAAWGPNPGHPADFDGDGSVGTSDLLKLLAMWGACG